MARIRTVKPELFRHEALFEAEQEYGLPIRLAFIGLFTVADRFGVFRWKPRQIKLDVMPYDNIDFSRVLDALATRGFVLHYSVDGEEYGVIPSFVRHQVVNNREKVSGFPGIDAADLVFPVENNDLTTRQPRVSHASATPLGKDQGEREGKGREGEGKGKGLRTVNASTSRQKTPAQEASAEVWSAYSTAYFNRYGTEPVRNAKVNANIAQLVGRVGSDAAAGMAEFFVGMNKRYYVEKLHPVGLLLSDCEAIHTQWATGRQMTSTRAGQIDQTQSNMNVADEAYELFMQMEENKRT